MAPRKEGRSKRSRRRRTRRTSGLKTLVQPLFLLFYLGPDPQYPLEHIRPYLLVFYLIFVLLDLSAKTWPSYHSLRLIQDVKRINQSINQSYTKPVICKAGQRVSKKYITIKLVLKVIIHVIYPLKYNYY